MPPTPRTTLAVEPFNPFTTEGPSITSTRTLPFVSSIVAAGDFKPLDFCQGPPGWSNRSASGVEVASPFDCVPLVSPQSCVPPIRSLLTPTTTTTGLGSLMEAGRSGWSPEVPDRRRVADEFDRLNALHEQQLEGTEGKGEAIYCSARARLNYHKNRYSNILALEHSRVKLMGANEFHLDSDYINANYIDGEVAGSKKAYICCQAPLINTLTHFWLMIWENECAVIIMLTRLYEREREKATQYWPEREGESRQFALFTVTLLKVKDVSAHLTLRKLRLEKDGVSRTVVHFHYTEWPDFGAPTSTQTIRDLVGLMDVYKMNGKIAGLNGPIVAHCSAGVGRAGTFVAIHMCLEKMKHQHTLEVNVPHTVLQLRRFRSGMVQSQEQYRFIYEVLRDAQQDLKEKAQRIFAGSGDAAMPSKKVKRTKRGTGRMLRQSQPTCLIGSPEIQTSSGSSCGFGTSALPLAPPMSSFPFSSCFSACSSSLPSSSPVSAVSSPLVTPRSQFNTPAPMVDPFDFGVRGGDVVSSVSGNGRPTSHSTIEGRRRLSFSTS